MNSGNNFDQHNSSLSKMQICALVFVGISALVAYFGYSDISAAYEPLYQLIQMQGGIGSVQTHKRLEIMWAFNLPRMCYIVSSICSLIWAFSSYGKRNSTRWLLILSIIIVFVTVIAIMGYSVYLNNLESWRKEGYQDYWMNKTKFNDLWICAVLLLVALIIDIKSAKSKARLSNSNISSDSAPQTSQANQLGNTAPQTSTSAPQAAQTLKNTAENVTEKATAFASKLASKLKNITEPATLNMPESEPQKPNLVGEVTPFKGPEGNVRGYMFDTIVYATKEQAEAARNEKEARVFEGVLYATKQEADAAREAKADLEARTFEGVVYETRELAEKARAEKEEIEYCTVDGIRYATREQADQARAEKAEIEYCTVDGVRYATREMADQIRAENADREARTVNGFVYATHEQADEAREKDRQARIYNGVEYSTQVEAQAARVADLAERTVDGVLYATKEEAAQQRELWNEFSGKLAVIFNVYDNDNVQYRPDTEYSFDVKKQLNEKLAEWLFDADEKRLLEWKRRIETVRAQKTTPMPLADLALKEIEKRLTGDAADTTQNETEKAADEEMPVAVETIVTEQPAPVDAVQKDSGKKNNKMIGIIAAAVLVVGAIILLPKSGNKPATQNTPQATHQQSAQYNRNITINGTKVNVRSAPSMKNSSVLFQLNDESVGTSDKRYTGDKYPWFKVQKNGREGWVYGRYVSE